MKIEMYTRDGCEFCENAKTYLTTMGLEYQEYNLTKGQATREEVFHRLEIKEDQKISLPVVFVNNLCLGGYDALVRYFALLDLNRAEINRALRSRVINVSFQKNDGSIRNMLCTLQGQYIKQPQPIQFDSNVTEFKPRRQKKYSPYVISVWDIDKGAWRSFKVDSIISWNPAEELKLIVSSAGIQLKR